MIQGPKVFDQEGLEELTPRRPEDEELDALIPLTSWTEFKTKIQEFGGAILKFDIDTTPNEIHLLRGNIGRLAESLRKQKQPFLAQILVVIETVLVSVVDAYDAIRQNKKSLPTLIVETLAIEEFIKDPDVTQLDRESTKWSLEGRDPQGQPEATKAE